MYDDIPDVNVVALRTEEARQEAQDIAREHCMGNIAPFIEEADRLKGLLAIVVEQALELAIVDNFDFSEDIEEELS